MVELNLWLNHHGPTAALAGVVVPAVAVGLLLVWRLFRRFDAWFDSAGDEP